jgi:FkbM family methyltransferase
VTVALEPEGVGVPLTPGGVGVPPTPGGVGVPLTEGVINVYGSMLRLDPADALFLGSHDYEPYETKLVIGICRPGDVVVDVGAMIGYYTVIFAKHVESHGKVYAFEPDPESFALLSSNVGMNEYSHVVCRNAMVGDETAPGRLFRAPHAHRGDNRSYETYGRDPVDVDKVKLDDVVDDVVDIVKVDVQGYEGHVLAGMRGLIERSDELTMFVEYAPTLLEMAGTDPADFLAELRSLGFVMFEIDEPNQRLVATDGTPLLDRHWKTDGYDVEYTNLLCVKAQR